MLQQQEKIMQSGRATMSLILSAVGMAWLAVSPVTAADLAPMAYSKAPVPAVAVFDWTGIYIGGHVGGDWQRTEFSDPGAFTTLFNCCLFIGTGNNFGQATNSNGSSFLGGVQAGAMYQIGRLVVGSDFDWSWTNLKGSGGAGIPPNVGGDFATEAYSSRVNWTATSTAVVGIARDHWMLYSKFGLAAANYSYSLGIAGLEGGGAVPFAFASNSSNTVIGWTTGVGVKWAITDNWVVNGEYDYLNFGSKAQSFSGVFTATPAAFGGSPAATFTPSFNQSISQVKLGLSYKFAPGVLFW
jgi:outer membrane immunogenic protein